MKSSVFLLCSLSIAIRFCAACMLNPVLQRLGNQVSELKEQRRVAVEQVHQLEDQLTIELARNNRRAIQALLDKLDQELWPKVVKLSEEIFDSTELISELAQETEDAYEEGLNTLVAGILVKAGVRKCPSLDEAFFKATNACEKMNSREENPCTWKDNQLLYEIENNEATCDCDEHDESLVYFMPNGRCYQLNTQGPCQAGQWIVFHQGVPTCRPVPAGCQADGEHAFGIVEHVTSDPACHSLRDRGPCSETERVERGAVRGTLVCKWKDEPTHALIPRRPSIRVRPLAGPSAVTAGSCPAGSYRYQTNKCRR